MPSSIRLPQAFAERMSMMLGPEYPDFSASYQAPRTNGLRINPLKIAPEDFLKKGIFFLEPIPWTEEGFYYTYTQQPGQHPYYFAGAYYLQEPSAMAVVAYLDPQPGERILDLAAAPGGKATHIASRLQQKGLLWANEINPARARILAANLERWGARNAIVSNESPFKLAERLPGQFDRLLLDAPCSGEGMFRKDPSAIQEWSPESVRACAQRQSLILESAARLLKPGGRLVYSTCTFSPNENEETILEFLARHPDFSPLPLPDPAPGFVHSPALPGTVRLYPYKVKGEGHFIAVLRKKPLSENNSESKKSHTIPGNSSKGISSTGNMNYVSPFQEFLSFSKGIIKTGIEALLSPAGNSSSLHFPDKRFLFFGSHLYWTPAPELPLQGLSILRPGLHLGEIKPGRFQPGQAFAFALHSEDVNNYLSLPLSDPRLHCFLRGETWDEPGEDGWLLVGVDEFPLGWAKRVQGQIKNHYAKELRASQRDMGLNQSSQRKFAKERVRQQS